MTIDQLAEENPEALLLDGFEAAFIGVSRRCGQPTLATYDREKCIEILMGQGMTPEEAEEYFSFNTEGAWVGPHTPVILDRQEMIFY
jgi:hypothetical protein